MRAIPFPNSAPQEVYRICVASVVDAALRNRLDLATADIIVAANDYNQRGMAKLLYTIPENNCADDAIVLVAVSKGELKSIYTTQMLAKTKPARRIYDLLLSNAPLGRCPFCGFGHASTLDHYLPKTKFPQFSVLPANLVPSCKDCNTGKSTSTATTAEEQCLHPYFDQNQFIFEQWLFADVMQTVPATIRFFVDPPKHWDGTSKARVQSHFAEFNLAKRYSIEASNQLACLKSSLAERRDILGSEGIRHHLEIEARSFAFHHLNSWQVAMFQALAASDWYCGGGFLLDAT